MAVPTEYGRLAATCHGDSAAASVVEVLAKGVDMPDLETAAAESLAKWRHEVFIELEGKHPVEPFEQGFGQRAPAGTDFEDPRRSVSQRSHDPLGDAGVDEEVLTQPVAFRSSHGRVMSFEF